MKWFIFRFFFILFVLAFSAIASIAEETFPGPFTGYFTDYVYIRYEPAAGSGGLAVIPPGTPVLLSPINDKYARVEYGGINGYLYYRDALLPPEAASCEPYTVYSDGRKYLLEYPLKNARSLLTLPSETPLTVTGETPSYLRVSTEGMTGYIHRRDMTSLTPDTVIEPRWVYSDTACVVCVMPIRRSASPGMVEAGKAYLANAENHDFYRVSFDSKTGYIPKKNVKDFAAGGKAMYFICSRTNLPLYALSDLQDKAGILESDTLYSVSYASEKWFRLSDNGLYVDADSVLAYAADPYEDMFVYISGSAELFSAPAFNVPSYGMISAEGAIYQVLYQVNRFYLIREGGKWGFISKQDTRTLSAKEPMDRTAAVTLRAVPSYNPDTGKAVTLKSGTWLFLSRQGSDFYRAEGIDVSGFVPRGDVRILGADAPVDPYLILAPVGIEVLSFPDSVLGVPIGIIPKGENVRVTGFNRCYLIVSFGGITGYAKAAGLQTAETALVPDNENAPLYYLFLDKSSRVLTVYSTDDSGGRTDIVVKRAVIAIGKRTTPTLSGVYMLGAKERWHAFEYSFTPYTVVYMKGRFVHGLPCEIRSLATVVPGMAESLGLAVSGGCLRCPTDIAEWIYFNCPSYLTTLEIVSRSVQTKVSAP